MPVSSFCRASASPEFRVNGGPQLRGREPTSARGALVFYPGKFGAEVDVGRCAGSVDSGARLDQKVVTGRSEKNRRKNQKSCPEESKKLPGRIRKVGRKIQKKSKSGAPKTWHGPTKNHTKRVPESEKKITGRSEKSRRKIQKNPPEDSEIFQNWFRNLSKVGPKFLPGRFPILCAAVLVGNLFGRFFQGAKPGHLAAPQA